MAARLSRSLRHDLVHHAVSVRAAQCGAVDIAGGIPKQTAHLGHIAVARVYEVVNRGLSPLTVLGGRELKDATLAIHSAKRRRTVNVAGRIHDRRSSKILAVGCPLESMH